MLYIAASCEYVTCQLHFIFFKFVLVSCRNGKSSSVQRQPLFFSLLGFLKPQNHCLELKLSKTKCCWRISILMTFDPKINPKTRERKKTDVIALRMTCRRNIQLLYFIRMVLELSQTTFICDLQRYSQSQERPSETVLQFTAHSTIHQAWGCSAGGLNGL